MRLHGRVSAPNNTIFSLLASSITFRDRNFQEVMRSMTRNRSHFTTVLHWETSVRVCACVCTQLVSYLAAESAKGGAQLKPLLRQNLPREITRRAVKARDTQEIRAHLICCNSFSSSSSSLQLLISPAPSSSLFLPFCLSLSLATKLNKPQLTFSGSRLHIIDWLANQSGRDLWRRPTSVSFYQPMFCQPAECLRGRSFLWSFFHLFCFSKLWSGGGAFLMKIPPPH